MKTRTGMLSDTNTSAMTALSFGVANAAGSSANRCRRSVRFGLMARPPLFEEIAAFRSYLGISTYTLSDVLALLDICRAACPMVRFAEVDEPGYARVECSSFRLLTLG